MASVDLTAASTGAAIVPAPTSGLLPAMAAGFDQALAEAQAAGAEAEAEADPAVDAPGAAPIAREPLRRDVRVSIWLAFGWVPAASAAVADGSAAAGDRQPETEESDRDTSAAGSDDPGSMAPVAAIPATTTAPTEVPATLKPLGSRAVQFDRPSEEGSRQSTGSGIPDVATGVREAGTTTPAALAGPGPGPNVQSGAAPDVYAGQPRDAAEYGDHGRAMGGGPSQPVSEETSGPEESAVAPPDIESRRAAAMEDRTRSVARAGVFARKLAERFQAVEATAVAEAPSPRSTWVDSTETPKTAKPSVRDGPMVPGPVPTPSTPVSPTAAVQPTQAAGLDAEAGEALRSQIIHTMRLHSQGGGGDAHIRLQPHYLGDLTISLRVEQGAVTAHLTAGQADVRQWIEANESMLRQHLAQHNLTLERLTVVEEEPTAQPREGNDGGGAGEHEPPPKPRRRRPDTNATFEVLV